jgi:glycosyltransferase involved in cell wall biosynthesis
MTADRTRPLRVAYLVLQPPSYSQTFITNEMRAVEAAGATVEMFVTRQGGRLDDLRRVVGCAIRHPLRLMAHVRALGPSYGARAVLAAAYALGICGQVGRFGPDIIHAHFVSLPAAVAVLVGRTLGRPVTAIAHAADFQLDRNAAALQRRLGQLDHLFVISAAAAGQLADRGVDMARISHSIVRAAFDGETVSRSSHQPGTPVRLVTVARLVEKKGVDTCIDAVAALVASGHHVRYDIFGDGPLRADLQRRATARGLHGAVHFHGAVSHQVATAAVAGADIAVLACRRATNGDLDGIPVFLMEAASRRVPVVTTAVSGIPELVDQRSGWLVPPDDAASLAGAIEQAIRDPVACRQRADLLAERVRTEFSPVLQAERLLAVWHELAGATAGTAPQTEEPEPSRVPGTWN